MTELVKLFVVEPLGSGGMIHYAYQLCTALAAQGARVTLVTAQDYELDDFPHSFAVEKRMRLWTLFDPTSSHLRRSRLARAWRRVRWTARRGLRAVFLIREWVRLTHYLLQEEPDLIQFGKINFPFEALFLALLRRRGLVLTQICHEFELREQSGPVAALVNKLYASVFGHFSAMFFHARSNRRRFLSLFNIPETRLHIIPHGSEDLFLAGGSTPVTEAALRQCYGLDDDAPVVLFFGVLTISKGLPDLLRAFALIREQNSRAKLVIAGFPSKYIRIEDLHAMVEDLGISKDVIFDGRYIPFEQVRPLIELATVVVYPYISSTQSGALQMAYTFGRPVIATRVGGLPEAVEDGQSGFLVSPGSTEELAAAMLKLVNDPGLAAEMGHYARHLSETRHSWTRIAGQILAVYETLL